MQFKADAKTLAGAVDAACRGVNARTSVQVLGGLRFETNGGALEVAGTDMGIIVRARVETDHPTMNGTAVAGPAKRILAALKTFDGDVDVEASEDRLAIRQGSTRVAFHLYELNDYPRLPGDNADTVVELPTALFTRLFDSVKRSYSRDASRPVLTGVQIEVDADAVRMVTTDSYRMAVEQVSHPTSLEGSTEWSAIVPGEVLEQVARFTKGADSVIVRNHPDSPHVSFHVGAVTVTARTIDGQYPQWRQLKPDSYPASFTIDRKALLAGVERINKLGTRNAPVRMVVTEKGRLALSYSNQDIGEIETVLPTVSQVGDPDNGWQAFGVNPEFLADALESHSSDDVTVRVINPLRPFLIQNGDADSWQLLMPVRLAG